MPLAPELVPVVEYIRLVGTSTAHAMGSGGDTLPAAVPDAMSCTLHHWLLPAELPVAYGGCGVEPPAASYPAAGTQCPACSAPRGLLPAALLHVAEPRGPPYLHDSPRLCSGLGPIEGQPHLTACVCRALAISDHQSQAQVGAWLLGHLP